MRTLKFRAFVHPYCGGDIPQEYYNSMDYSDNYGGDLEDFFSLYKPHFFEVMQFIGLTDKNGKEIYEGDIVKARGALVFSNLQVKENSLREIYRTDAGFTGVRINSGFDKTNPSSIHNWSNYTLWNVSHDLEVIGNIYQNLELL